VTANQVNGHKAPLTMPVFGEWQPVTPPQPDPKAETDRAEAAALLAQANDMHVKASKEAERTRTTARAELDQARAEAQQIREQAETASASKAKRGELVNEWSPRVALAATIGLTASGEFALAQIAGWAPGIAWLLPLAIDVYVVQAFRRHRDVAPALILMVVANAIYHLAAEGLFGVARAHGKPVLDAHGSPTPEWWLIVGVAAIAPLVMWRIHRITAPLAERKPRQAERAQAPAQTLTEAPVSAPAVVEGERLEVSARTERPALTPALTPASTERAHSERSVSVGAERERAQTERPKKSASERTGRAHRKPKKDDTKTLTDRRRERVRALYDELGKRPEWTEIRDALVAGKLADAAISRSSCQRVRDAIEADHPELAALGSDNVRPLTGS